MSIAARFGTWRGLVRLALAHATAPITPRASLAGVGRLVFVCRGNICRSAFADALARSRGVEAASFGLRTAAGRPAHPPVTEEARQCGIDLAAHEAVPVEQFAPAAGDLYLVMERRQIAELRSVPGYEGAAIDLLGRYGGVPHLHDPYGLSREFTATSLGDITRSVDGLIAALRRS